MNRIHLQHICVLVCLCLLTACSSPAKIQYYSLDVPADAAESTISAAPDWPGVGVGPITLPPTLQHLGIVSETGSSQVSVSGTHLWAGDLDRLLTHLLSDQLATLSGSPHILPHPWDHRLRPEYQIKIHIEAFGGSLEGPIQLRVNWVLLGERGKPVLLRQRQRYSITTTGSGYAAYVTSLNQLVIQFGTDLHQHLENYWAHPKGS